MKRKILSYLLLFVAIWCCSPDLSAQPEPVLNRRPEPKVEDRWKSETVKLQLDSRLMGRPMPYQVIFPIGYKNGLDADRRFPVVFLLHGLSGHHDNWISKTMLVEYAAHSNAIVVTPEGGDGWYTDGGTNGSEKWESYIIKELIPEIDKKFRTIPTREKRAIAGLSMGGYGALKFGIKFPDMFVLAGSFSGALKAADYTVKSYPGEIGNTVEHIYGPIGSYVRKENDLFELLRSQSADSTKKLPFIYLDCGTEDFLFQDSRDFGSLLIEKKVLHEYRQLPGAHNWAYWDKQVQEFLELADRKFAGR
jgi:putative tributyrin esterase